ncbi:MAG: D-cysteine desulfhydrase family protein [Gammaproteobacteria bacterium]|nr:D-cysteine desulfhydrase family protein [Gammaproteobacteria bacterium]
MALPGLTAFPRTALGHAPTPLEAASRLSDHLGINLLITRDDCNGLALGGNKVRQLEYYLGEALAQGADTVLITGAVQSNFVRLTAAAANLLGLATHIQLEQRVATSDPAYHDSGNVLLDRLLSATIHHFEIGEDEAAADANLERIAEGLRAQGARPYVIHLGIEHRPIGALGYVRAAYEICSQLAAQNQPLSHVVIASGSGLTHSGLLVGLRALGQSATVHGICVRREAVAQAERIERRTKEVAALIAAEDCMAQADVRVMDDALAPGYGQMSAHVYEAMQVTARSEAILLDPVYTAKTMAGLFMLVRSGEIAPGSDVLFVHTGGSPALFGYQTSLSSYL